MEIFHNAEKAPDAEALDAKDESPVESDRTLTELDRAVKRLGENDQTLTVLV